VRHKFPNRRQRGKPGKKKREPVTRHYKTEEEINEILDPDDKEECANCGCAFPTHLHTIPINRAGKIILESRIGRCLCGRCTGWRKK
jgi:hypothetical protein